MRHERKRSFYIILISTVIFLGLSSRFFAKVLPNWVNLYLGDILWALMVFLVIGFLWKKRSTTWVATVASVFSLVIELSQLYHAPWIDNIRRTTIGGLIFGYGFLWSDLVSYLVGVVIGVLLEKLWFFRERNNKVKV